MCTGQHAVCTQEYYWVLGSECSVKRFLYSLFRLSKVHWRIDRIRFSIPLPCLKRGSYLASKEYQLNVPTACLLTINVLPDRKHPYRLFLLQLIIPSEQYL